MSDLRPMASAFARGAHAGQTRKYTGERYYVHPQYVAMLVAMAGGTDEMVAAGFLHDTVEDCKVLLSTIEEEFGPVVREYVDWLTEIPDHSQGNRAHRKKLVRERLAQAPPPVHTLKVADLLHNSYSIREHDPHFWLVFKEEATLLLEVLVHAHPELVKLLLEELAK